MGPHHALVTYKKSAEVRSIPDSAGQLAMLMPCKRRPEQPAKYYLEVCCTIPLQPKRVCALQGGSCPSVLLQLLSCQKSWAPRATRLQVRCKTNGGTQNRGVRVVAPCSSSSSSSMHTRTRQHEQQQQQQQPESIKPRGRNCVNKLILYKFKSEPSGATYLPPHKQVLCCNHCCAAHASQGTKLGCHNDLPPAHQHHHSSSPRLALCATTMTASSTTAAQHHHHPYAQVPCPYPNPTQ